MYDCCIAYKPANGLPLARHLHFLNRPLSLSRLCFVQLACDPSPLLNEQQLSSLELYARKDGGNYTTCKTNIRISFEEDSRFKTMGFGLEQCWSNQLHCVSLTSEMRHQWSIWFCFVYAPTLSKCTVKLESVCKEKSTEFHHSPGPCCGFVVITDFSKSRAFFMSL